MPMRQQVAAGWRKGQTRIAIAEQFHLSYNTVCRICQRVSTQGPSALSPHYFNCGRRAAQGFQPLVYRAALWLKRLHPGWGAAFIVLKLKEHYKRKKIPSDRTLQRWFHRAGLYKARSRFPEHYDQWALKAQDTWQVDAKEKLRLKDGKKVCYLSVVDEQSGSLLKAVVFPPVPYKRSKSGCGKAHPGRGLPALGNAQGH
jgi:hypothetical protein